MSNLPSAANWSTIWSDTLPGSTFALNWTNAGETARWFRTGVPANLKPGLAIQPAGGAKLDLTLQRVAAGTYTIQTATNLLPNAVWTIVWTGVPGNAPISLQWTGSGEPTRFFRVIRP